MDIRRAYEILGVSSKSTQEEIRKAYRASALQVHPDKNPDDPEASQKFIDVSNAYERITNNISGANDEDDDDENEYNFYEQDTDTRRHRTENPEAFFDFMFYSLFGERRGQSSNYDDVFEKEYREWEELRAKNIEENRRMRNHRDKIRRARGVLGLNKKYTIETVTRAFNSLTSKYSYKDTKDESKVIIDLKDKYDEVCSSYDIILKDIEEKERVAEEKEKVRLFVEKNTANKKATEREQFEKEREARGRDPFRNVAKDVLVTCHKCGERYVPQKNQRCDVCGVAEPELQARLDAEKAAKRSKGNGRKC